MNLDDFPGAPTPLSDAFSARMERAENLLSDHLERVAEPFTDGGERRAAKIGAMRAMIHTWAARYPNILRELEYYSKI